MRPSRWRDLEVMGGIVLFVVVMLTLVIWALYARGYLGTAAATVGSVLVFVGLIRALQVWSNRRRREESARRQEEEEQQQRWLGWEQEERQPHSGEKNHSSMAEESRQEEEEEEEEEEVQRQPEESTPDALLQRINEISDREFGQLMAYYFRHRGYTVDATPASGDRGTTLVLAVADRRIAVQLKHQDEPVDSRAVQEVLAGRAFYGAYEAWLITDNVFTRDARNDARIAGVRLIDGEELAEWLTRFPEQPDDEPR